MRVRDLPRPARWGMGVACGAVLLLGGCGESKSPGVASAAPAGATQTAGQSAPGGVEGELAAYLKSRRDWVGCMRKNGIDLPDPDSKGEVKGNLDKMDPKVNKAATACSKHFAVDMSPQLSDHLKPVATPAQLEAQKLFAKCMRDNGVSNFPDPRADGKGDPPPIVGAQMGPTYTKAQTTCFGLPEMKKAYPDWHPGMESVG